MTIVNIQNENTKIDFNSEEVKTPYYLIFRKFEDNYYIGDHTHQLDNNLTPTDSLVCEITHSWDKVVEDKLHLHELPKKLPLYIIEGFRKRLEHDVKRSLYNEYKIYEEQNMLSLFDIEHEIFIKKKFNEKKDYLVSNIKLSSKIEEFYNWSMLIQRQGAINIF